jgi:predicted anti-sigma-YlaC factor YlaD
MPMSTGEHPVGCRSAREWLSAFRDGEAFHDEPAARHLATCEACAAWVRALDGLTGRLRLRPAARLDLVGPALAAWRAGVAGRRRLRVAAGRAVLAAAAVTGVLLAASRLAGVPALSPSIGAHAGRELAGFEAALAVGFALAAWRPRQHAGGLLWVALTVAALTLAGSATDVLGGRSQLAAEAAHLPLLAGVVGLALTRPARRRPGPPAAHLPGGHPTGGPGPHPPPTPITG